jgi:hypothetical protein
LTRGVVAVGEVVGDAFGGGGGLVPWVARLDGGRFGAGGGEASADLREGEVGGEGGAGVEHRRALVVGVAGQGEVAAECVAGRAALEAHAHAGGLQQGEELGLVRCGGDGASDPQAQDLAGGGVLAQALGLEVLLAGGAFGGGAVPRLQPPQPVVDFDLAGFALDGALVVIALGAAAVLADEGGGDVDVVVGVADGHPAAGFVVALGGDAGGGHDPAGDVGPLGIGEERVFGCGTDGAVPHGVLGCLVAEHLHGLVELRGELGLHLLGVAVGAAAGVGGEVVPRGHQVRVDVLVGPALAEEVTDRAARGLGPLSEDDLRDQGLTAPR